MEAYKDWACSQNIEVYQNETLRQPCSEYCKNVLQVCPYLLPDDDYGLPAFDCTTLELGEESNLPSTSDCYGVFPSDHCKIRTIPTEAPAPTSDVVSGTFSPETKPTTAQQPTPPLTTPEEPTTVPTTTEEFTSLPAAPEIPSVENGTEEVPTITSENSKNATASIDTPS